MPTAPAVTQPLSARPVSCLQPKPPTMPIPIPTAVSPPAPLVRRSAWSSIASRRRSVDDSHCTCGGDASRRQSSRERSRRGIARGGGGRGRPVYFSSQRTRPSSAYQYLVFGQHPTSSLTIRYYCIIGYWAL
eukprot:scaffold286796_cov32-Tisochrysis_lutea.AAC.2